jgi:hypothetical protein
MVYVNKEKEGRKIIIPVVEDAFSELSSKKRKGFKKIYLTEYDPVVSLYLRREQALSPIDRNLYNFPFLFGIDGFPWIEANSYLLSLAVRKHATERPTDDIRIKASRLLEYKLFCERENLDWLDFTGMRPSNRPTYKYFKYLYESSNRKAAVINQFTAVVYDFYTYVSKHWHPIDMDKVDTIKQFKRYIQSSSGSFAISGVKRSLTLRTPPSSPLKIGYVNDEGENLKPLKNAELDELLEEISTEKWSQLERLIIKTALLTGARKQTVLTIRIKHLDRFTESFLLENGTYRLDAGPGTCIDTKYSSPKDE